MAVKVFTLEEANRLLPQIERGVRFLSEAAQNVHKLQDQVSVLSLLGSEKSESPEHREFKEKKKRFEELVVLYNRKLEELQRLGCIMKDLRTGLVDFYGSTEGRLIFFCWKLGEKEIAFWHELDGGFRGRRPVSEL